MADVRAVSAIPGWHPEPVDDVPLLRSELDACRAEIARLRAENAELRRGES